jgi:general secretion pathway protein I
MMKARQQGFTLIEVMVAVAILGIALPALMYSMISQVESSAYLRDKLQAQWVAENVLNLARLENRVSGRVKKGKDEGSEELANQTWYWRSKTEVFAQEEFKDIYGIEVRVYKEKDDAEDESVIRLVGILRQYPQAAFKLPQPVKPSESAQEQDQNAGEQQGEVQ